jgi:steroid delta-isomerase-like uncharacterized protein
MKTPSIYWRFVRVKALVAVLLLAAPAGCTHAEERPQERAGIIQWYRAFSENDSSLVEGVLDDHWADIPHAPGQPAGPEGLRWILKELRTAFPDFKASIQDILRDGNKFIVRSELSGTQKEAFMGNPGKGQKLRIQAIDIHEFKDGKIIRSWHTEDWLTGLHQLGVLPK